jgi:Raf kinase inhibitor-like YbhB/YbcL family protein
LFRVLFHQRDKEMNLVSNSFAEGEFIPPLYTCDGANISPPLSWSGLPKGTRSLALICDDPDAPGGDFVHWVLFNIPPEVGGVEEGQPRNGSGPGGSVQGMTDFGRPGYGGPCPPRGTHRYYFRLFALDAMLEGGTESTKSDLMYRMEGRVLARCTLMAYFKREKS